MRLVASIAGILLLSCVHLFYGSLHRFLSKHVPHWTSLAGGVAVAYVFLYMFPKLSDFTATIVDAENGAWEPLQYRLYFFALLGFLFYQASEFYSDRKSPEAGVTEWTHAAGFCIYNMLIGYIATSMPRVGILPIILAILPIGLHLIGMNHMLSTRLGALFMARLRWMLAFSLYAGWLLGQLASLPLWITTGFTAFVAGAIIINVISEELPDRGVGSLKAFMLGVLCFVAFMTVIRSIPRIG